MSGGCTSILLCLVPGSWAEISTHPWGLRAACVMRLYLDCMTDLTGASIYLPVVYILRLYRNVWIQSSAHSPIFPLNFQENCNSLKLNEELFWCLLCNFRHFLYNLGQVIATCFSLNKILVWALDKKGRQWNKISVRKAANFRIQLIQKPSVPNLKACS